MKNKKFLELVRGAIAVKNIQKKQLARKCKLSRPQFSELIHGDRQMTDEIKARLIAELNLESTIQKIDALQDELDNLQDVG